MKYWVAMGFTDTKTIMLDVLYGGTPIDSFIVDTGTVVKYNDKKTSLERIYSDQGSHITGASIATSRNILSGYLANPGSVAYEQSTTPSDGKNNS